MPAATHFRTQAGACAAMGSPMYAELIARLADDVDAKGPAYDVIGPWRDEPGPAAIALRLVGALHRLVLAGQAPELAAYYPTAGGSWSLPDAWPIVAEVLHDQRAAVADAMATAPQTNEVGRSAVLMAGLLALRAEFPQPVRIFEIGASAGLNLLFDQFSYLDDAGTAYGAPDSEVLIADAWQAREFADRTVEVVDRRGCDVAPVPLETDADRARLLSYVWPDQPERFNRTRGALALARRISPEVEKSSAIDFVRRIDVHPETLTVLWHSIMWQYVDPAEQDALARQIAALGARASSAAPFVHLRMEPRRRSPDSPHEFLLTQDVFDGRARSSLVARCGPHGPPVEWEPA